MVLFDQGDQNHRAHYLALRETRPGEAPHYVHNDGRQFIEDGNTPDDGSCLIHSFHIMLHNRPAEREERLELRKRHRY